MTEDDYAILSKTYGVPEGRLVEIRQNSRSKKLTNELDWPSHSAELARKALSSVQDIARRLKSNDITQREAFIALDVLYDSVMGLVDREVSDVIYRARNETKTHEGNPNWGNF